LEIKLTEPRYIAKGPCPKPECGGNSKRRPKAGNWDARMMTVECDNCGIFEIPYTRLADFDKLDLSGSSAPA